MTAKSTHAPAKPAAPPAPAPGIIGCWVNFWFAPADPIGLSALRVLGGLLFLFWLLPFAGEHQALFGLGGWFDATAYREASHLPNLPPHAFGWSVVYLCGSNPVALTTVYWLSVVAVLLFTLGVATRLTGVLTWVAVVSYTANPALAYDAEPLLILLAFYLMVGYLLMGLRRPGQSWPARAKIILRQGALLAGLGLLVLAFVLIVSWGAALGSKLVVRGVFAIGVLTVGLIVALARLLGPQPTWLFGRATAEAPAESVGANVALRLFQVHFAIAMVASGLHKLQIKEWWNGLAPWFYVHPPFHTTAEELRSYAPQAAGWLTFLSLCSYLALAWQLGFPAFAWRRGAWRVVSLGGAALAWLVCTFWVPLPLFGPLLVVACLGYLSPAEWRRLLGFVTRLPGVRRLAGRLSEAPAGSVLPGPKSGAVVRSTAISVGLR